MRLPAPAGHRLRREHAEHHRRHRDGRADAPGAERHQRGARAISREPPADAEDRRAHQELGVDARIARPTEIAAQEGMGAAFGGAKGPEADDDSTAHHEHQAGIPRSQHVEEGLHFERIGHPAESQPEGEEKTADRRNRVLLAPVAHSRPRVTATVSIPVATKTSVATMERGDRRLIPQSPCPEVHPLPSVVPTPTRNPPMAIVGRPVELAAPKTPGEPRRQSRPPTTSPPRKYRRQERSSPRAPKLRPTIPEIPAMRPSKRIKSEIATPSTNPPRVEPTGVKPTIDEVYDGHTSPGPTDEDRAYSRLDKTSPLFGGRASRVRQERFQDLLGATNLIPGPNSTEMAIHIGWSG